MRNPGEGGQLADFIDGLGPGQLVGRQVLGAPALGDIQLSLCYQKGFLEVEVIRARYLQARPGSKVLPGNFFRTFSPPPLINFIYSALRKSIFG